MALTSSTKHPIMCFQFRTFCGVSYRGPGYRAVKAWDDVSCFMSGHYRKYNVGMLQLGWRNPLHKYDALYSTICPHEKNVGLCTATQSQNCETDKCYRPYEDVTCSSPLQCEGYSETDSDSSSRCHDDEELFNPLYSDDRHFCFSHLSPEDYQGLAKAAIYACNDARFMNERARNDINLLSRGINRLNDRARQDFAFLGSEFLKLDARAREDSEKIDSGVKSKAAILQRIAEGLTDKAQISLRTAAAEHWSDGALEADLKLADRRARQRAMEDTLMALEFVKNIHRMMVRSMYRMSKSTKSKPKGGLVEGLKVEKEGKARKIYPGKISDDQIAAIQSAYWNMASALSEADGIDYTNPDELEILVATLLDMDAIDGKRSVSILVECSTSPDVSTRQALANALADAPSMWTLGNAGMGALQRLSEDSNPAVASAASKAIEELKKQWQIEEGDTLVFSMDESKDSSEILNSETTMDTNDEISENR